MTFMTLSPLQLMVVWVVSIFDKVAMNNPVQVFFVGVFSFLLGNYVGEDLLSHREVSTLLETSGFLKCCVTLYSHQVF